MSFFPNGVEVRHLATPDMSNQSWTDQANEEANPDLEVSMETTLSPPPPKSGRISSKFYPSHWSSRLK